MQKRWLSVSEAAEVLGVSESTVRRRVKTQGARQPDRAAWDVGGAGQRLARRTLPQPRIRIRGFRGFRGQGGGGGTHAVRSRSIRPAHRGHGGAGGDRAASSGTRLPILRKPRIRIRG